MQILSMSDFHGGWLVGKFHPSLMHSEEIEVAVKSFQKGEVEPEHFQKVATEATIVVSGVIRMGEIVLRANEILVLSPQESCDFEALEDATVVGIKWPSIPDDKVVIDKSR
jgi:hypothetical protein